MTTTKLPQLPEDYRAHLPHIDMQELRIMWQSGYWDGPLSGVMAYKNKPHWFEIVTHDTEVWEQWGNDRYFFLLELSEEQYQEELYWNTLFREKVGTHWDYDENGKLKKDGVQNPQGTSFEFYNAAKSRKPRDFTNNIVVGWFKGL